MTGAPGNAARRSRRQRRLPKKLLDSETERIPPTQAKATRRQANADADDRQPARAHATVREREREREREKPPHADVALLLKAARRLGDGMSGAKRPPPSADGTSPTAQPAAKRPRRKRSRNAQGMFEASPPTATAPPVPAPPPTAAGAPPMPAEPAPSTPTNTALPTHPRADFQLNDADAGTTSSSSDVADASGLAEAEVFVNQQHRRLDHANANQSLLTGITADNWGVSSVAVAGPPAIDHPPAALRLHPEPVLSRLSRNAAVNPAVATALSAAPAATMTVIEAAGTIALPSATNLRTPSPAVGTPSEKKCARQSYTLLGRQSSSESEPVLAPRRLSAEFLEKSTEPVVQCSTPLKLKLRGPDGESPTGREVYPPLQLRLHLKRSTFRELFSWNVKTRAKSDEPMLTSALVDICLEERDIFVYHGQDSEEWKIHVAGADVVHWVNNERNARKQKKRIRIFDTVADKMLAFKNSPTLSRLEDTLKDNKLKVFTSSVSSFKPLSLFETTPEEWFKTFVLLKIHLPLKRVRAQIKCFIRPGRTFFWDCNQDDKMKPKRGPLKEDTTLACIQKRYEVYHGQDVLMLLGQKKNLELIPISERAPAHLLDFWDTERGKVVSGDQFEENNLTLGEVMDQKTDIDLYIGQDLDSYYIPSIREKIKFDELSSLGLYKLHHCLAFRGEEVTKRLFNRNFIPDVVSLDSVVVSSYNFWDVMRGRLVPFDKAYGYLVGDFLRLNEGRYEPYVGQNLSGKLQKQLRKWFEVLKWRPGCHGKNMVCMVMSNCNIQLEPVFVPRKRGVENATAPRSKPSKKSGGRRRRPTADANPSKEKSKPAHLVESDDDDSGKNVVLSDVASEDSDRVQVNMGKFQGFFVSKRRAAELEKYSKSSRVPVRHKPSGLVLLAFQSPTRANLSIFLKTNSDYEIFDRYSCTPEEEATAKSITHNSDDLFRAKLAGELESNRLLYFVNVILASKIGGTLAKEKEELEEELSFCGQFPKLLDVLCTGQLVDKGQSLLETLEELDVYNLCTHDELSVLGTCDLLSIRDNMHLGISFLIHDVTQAFREVLAAVLQFHPVGTIMHEDAVIMLREGEHAVCSFSFENMELMRQDKALFNIRQIVARAESLMKSSNCGTEIDLTKSNVVQGNPYMNNRDDNGYSYMSKRQGAKVLGPVMDVHRSYFVDLEREHWLTDTKCLLCGSEIPDVYSNALICSNRVYGICERIICRGCICRKAVIDEEDFVDIRGGGQWICVHCTGTGKKKQRSYSKKNDTAAPFREVTFAFKGSDDFGAQTVTAAFCQRHRNGVFPEEFGENCAMSAPNEKGQMLSKKRLACGEYRVRISVNNNWYASSLLHVYPVRSLGKTAPEVIKDRPSLFDDWTEGRKIAQKTIADLEQRQKLSKPVVVWKEGRSDGTGRVMSLLSDHVRCNSRTEGYNWKAPKRHNVQRWKPEISGCIPKQLPTIVTTNEESFLPVEDQAPGGSESLFTMMLVKQKKSYEEYCKALMAKKYEKMKNESLWGLVVCRSLIHGSGLFTVTGLGIGDFIIEYAGEIIRTPLTDIREAKYFEAGLGTYMFTLDQKRCIDATIASNRARFVNHSCDPNMFAQIVTVNGRDLIVLAACRPIPPFSELTFNYQFDIETDGAKKLKCQCKSWNCQGQMN